MLCAQQKLPPLIVFFSLRCCGKRPKHHFVSAVQSQTYIQTERQELLLRRTFPLLVLASDAHIALALSVACSAFAVGAVVVVVVAAALAPSLQ